MKSGVKNMNTVIQARIDTESKKQAEKILQAMGMTLNDAVRIFVRQIIHSRALPFQPQLPSEEEFIAQAIADAETDVKAGNVYGPFNNVEELLSDLAKDD